MTDAISTRQRILDQAIELTVLEGAQSLSMRKIAARVGLTPMAIYRHFKDKGELEQVLLRHAFDRFEEYLKRAQTGDTPEERLISLAQGFFSFALERPQHFELLFLSAVNPRQTIGEPAVKDASSPTYRLLQETVGAWVDKMSSETINIRDVTLDILAFCVGHAALYISGSVRETQSHAFERFDRAFQAFLDRFRAA